MTSDSPVELNALYTAYSKKFAKFVVVIDYTDGNGGGSGSDEGGIISVLLLLHVSTQIDTILHIFLLNH